MAKEPKRAKIDTSSSLVYHQPRVMAEIGCNHMGDLQIAKELLLLAKAAGCDYGKFQKRNPKELLTAEQYAAPHPNPRNSYGDTYGAHREFLELTVEQHAELKKYCGTIGLGYSCSVWDCTSAREIVSLKPDLIKVGSPSNTHWEMQKILRDEYDGDVHSECHGLASPPCLPTPPSRFYATLTPLSPATPPPRCHQSPRA